MYAVITSGGKQYRVKEGLTIKVDTIAAEVGSKVNIQEVLLLADGDNIKIGKPFVEGSKVTASIVSHGRGKKIQIIKFKRRKHHMKRMGHRQNYTEIKIEKVA